MYSGIQTQQESRTPHQGSSVLIQLSEIINNYLLANPNVSLNGLSKRCQVSEPTIRRISKRQVKTIPNVSTVLDLLTTISRKKSIPEVIELYPGPVAEYIREMFPHVEEAEPEYSNSLNACLKEPLKYLIFKLSLNKMGVTRDRIKRLFGEHGLRELDELTRLEFIEKRGQRFHSIYRHMTMNQDFFVDQFRATASFIKPHKMSENLPMNPLFVNASASISADTYKEITKIQRQALKKISQSIRQDSGDGPIPVFFLCALDTLDTDSAFEIAIRDEKNSLNH